jgi:hypothetical protein
MFVFQKLRKLDIIVLKNKLINYFIRHVVAAYKIIHLLMIIQIINIIQIILNIKNEYYNDY